MIVRFVIDISLPQIISYQVNLFLLTMCVLLIHYCLLNKYFLCFYLLINDRIMVVCGFIDNNTMKWIDLFKEICQIVYCTKQHSKLCTYIIFDYSGQFYYLTQQSCLFFTDSLCIFTILSIIAVLLAPNVQKTFSKTFYKYLEHLLIFLYLFP